MATILMTGVTGTVMNPLCARLLEEGHTVIALVRPAKGSSPKERLQNSLQIGESERERLFVLAGDIAQPLAGVSPEDQQRWKGGIDKVVHGAASIKFVETPDNQVTLTNLGGTKNMLRLAEVLGVPEFHYVSTAYVCGDAKYFTEGNFGEEQHHRNAYEASKAKAEQLVRGFSGRFSIYRIPVVVGNSQTGEINGFSGYYGFFAPFWQLFQTLQSKNWEGLPEGIQRDGEGSFCVPLWLPCTTAGPINLVPLDWLTDMFLGLLKVPARRQTFHLTHPHPRTVKETIEVSAAYLGICGLGFGTPNGNTPKFLARLQRGVLTGIKPFEPYTSKDQEHFDNAIAVQALGKDWKDPPDIDSAVMGRLLDFAKSKNFGRSSGE